MVQPGLPWHPVAEQIIPHFLCFVPGLRAVAVVRGAPVPNPAPRVLKLEAAAELPNPGAPNGLVDAAEAAGVANVLPKLKAPAQRHSTQVSLRAATA